MNENELTLYGSLEIEREVEARAAANDGVISDEDLSLLVQAQTTSLVKLEGLLGWITKMDDTIEACKARESAVAEVRKAEENRLKRIKDFLVPFVQDYRDRTGHPMTVGTFKLSTRKSTSVQIEDEAWFKTNLPNECRKKVLLEPDKVALKEKLEAGQTIPGCHLQMNVNLSIK